MKKILVLIGGIIAIVLGASFLSVEESPQMEEKPFVFIPTKKESVPALDLSLRSAGIFYVASDGTLHNLYLKNPDLPTPIASVTKLMLALVSAETYAEIDSFTFDRTALEGKGPSGFYREGERLMFPELLHSLLIESNNDAARLLAQKNGADEMLRRMNDKASELGMSSTTFRTVSGLDLDSPHEASNFSTPRDLSGLLLYLQEEHPEILEITAKSEYIVKDAAGREHHVAKATNKLLGDSSLGILGGKTGDTPLAHQNLVVLLPAPRSGGFLISVVLGSEDHFGDTRKAIEWVREAYVWE